MSSLYLVFIIGRLKVPKTKKKGGGEGEARRCDGWMDGWRNDDEWEIEGVSD